MGKLGFCSAFVDPNCAGRGAAASPGEVFGDQVGLAGYRSRSENGVMRLNNPATPGGWAAVASVK
jgi:hypothetical protein